MIADAVILPNDDQLLSIALRVAAEHGYILQTDGRRCCMAAYLLPGYARITGGGSVRTIPPPTEAA